MVVFVAARAPCNVLDIWACWERGQIGLKRSSVGTGRGAAQLEAQRQEFEAQRKELEAKLEAKLEAQRKDFEAQRKEFEAKACAQSRTDKVTALQLRLDVLSDSKLLEDEELAAIEDKVADAIGVAGVEDGAESVWDCVMQMIRLSEGIGSEKMFARQLRRKFL